MVDEVPVVWEAVGRSVVSEEYKGDFALAHRLTAEDPSAEAALARGVVAVMAGDPGRAVMHLDGVAGADDAVLRARAASHRHLATQMRWNAFPGGAGGGATEISARWDPFGESMPDGDDTGHRGDWQLVGALSTLRMVRAILEHAAVRQPPSEVDERLEDALGVVAPLRGRPALQGYTDLAAADLAHRARRPQRRDAFLHDAIAAYEGVGDQAGVAACHLARGDWLAAPGSTPQARNLTLVASGAESSALDWALEAVEGSLAGFDPDGATLAYDEAEEAFDAADAPRGVAAVALHRSHLAAVTGDFETAAELAEQAAVAFRDRRDRWGACLAAVHGEIAAIGMGRLAAGAQTAADVGAWGREEGSFSYALGLGVLLSRAGRDWLLRRADAERSLAAHRLARTLFAALGATTDEAQSLADRGRVLQVVGELDGALTAYEDACDLLEADLQVRSSVVEANRLRVIALAHQIYNLHLAARDTAGMSRSANRLLTAAARVPAGHAPDSVEARYASWALDTAAQAPVLELTYRAEDARRMGDPTEAERSFAAALEAARSMAPVQADFFEAVVLGHWRRYSQASASYQRFLDQVMPDAVAHPHAATTSPDTAADQLERLRLHEQAGAFFHRLRDHRSALSHFEALERLDGVGWWQRLEQPWQSLSDFGTTCEGTGQLARAMALHERAIAELQTRRERLRRDELRTALAGTVGAAPVHFAAARTALLLSEAAAGSGDEAQARALAERSFGYAEQGRARSLLDLMATSAALAGSGAEQSSDVRAWHQANAELSLRWGLLAVEQSAPHPDEARLAALRTEARAAETELLRREAALDRSDTAFAAVVTGRSAVWSVADLSAALAPGVVVLVYQYLGDDLLAWAVTADGLAKTHRAAVDADDLTWRVRRFTDACARPGANWDLRGEELVPTLLEPFATVLESCEQLVIVPSGAAHAMAFHALPWRGSVLGAVHTVSYLPSASSLQFLVGAAPSAHDGVLAVGNPSAMAWQALPSIPPAAAEPLPAAETEARFIAAVFDHARLLVAEEATEEAVRAALPHQPRVHLATHGQLSAELPLLSCVLLAEGEALSVYELMGIGLDADLVVLSACESGRGLATTGGDVLGLTRALLATGARGLIVTLWHADDVSTCVLMADFYRRVRSGVPHSRALAEAQQHLRRMDVEEEAAAFAAIADAARDPRRAADLLAADHTAGGERAADSAGPSRAARDRHPHYWAPFVFVGVDVPAGEGLGSGA